MTERAVLIVRNSELSTFRQCRQKWEWAYMHGLRTKRNRPALSFGSLVHGVMERFYIPGLKRGGKPYLLWEDVWAEFIAAGNEDFQVAKDVMASDLGFEMMKNYWDEYGTDSRFKILCPEQTFQIDVYDDDGTYLGVFTGTVDAVMLDRQTKKIGLFEHKTGASLDPFGAPLIMDEQAGSYWTFGAMYLRSTGMLNEDLDFVLYNRLRKAFKDKRPQDADGRYLNKDGTISKTQPLPLFKREYTFRTEEDRRSVYERVVQQMYEIQMVKDGDLGVYKNPDRHCGYCEFRDMCEVHEVRSDWEAVRDETMTTWDPYADHREGLDESDS